MYQAAVDFDGHLLTGTAKDIFVVSYDPLGNIRWASSAGGTGTDCALSVAIDNSGKVAICGYYLLNCSFGGVPVPYAQNTDLFIAQMNTPPVGIRESQEDDFSVLVYPNPCSDGRTCMLGVQIDGSAEAVSVRIFDVLGKEIFSDAFSSTVRFSLSDFQPGVYFVTISTGAKMKTTRWVKQ
jgi:hypothetical protein